MFRLFTTVTSNELEFVGIMKSTHIYIPVVAQKGDLSFGTGGRCPKVNLVEFWPKQDDGVDCFLIFARRVPCFMNVQLIILLICREIQSLFYQIFDVMVSF